MTTRRRVADHLGDSALYAAVTTPVSQAWKLRLLARFTPAGQLSLALQDRTSPWIWGVSVAIPFLCAGVLISAYLGLVHPALWLEGFYRTVSLDLPVIGLKETVLFTAGVAAATLLLKSRLSY